MTNSQARQQAAPLKGDGSYETTMQSGAEREDRDPEAEAPEPVTSTLADAARRSGIALDRMENSKPTRRFRLAMDQLEDNWALSAAVILVALVAGAVLV
jgi:hypothetical protein